jgi:glucokinase
MNDRVLALEIGGTKLQAAIGFDENGGMITRRGAAKRGTAKAQDGAKAILDWFAENVPPLLDEAARAGLRVRRIGAGFGGPVESATGKVLTSHQVEGWSGFEMKPWFEKQFGIETLVFNDSNAAGWAEYRLGAGRGTRTFLYSNIGSGIGGALVIDGKLQDGQGMGAAEVGHMYVPDWESNFPGATKKLEDLCSGWSIERRQRALDDPPPDSPLGKLCGGKSDAITCAMLGEAAKLGDMCARQELDSVAQSGGLALANVVTLVHPEKIALGGGVSLMGGILLTPVARWANHYVFGPFMNTFAILPCQLGENVVLAGSLLLAGAKPTGGVDAPEAIGNTANVP